MNDKVIVENKGRIGCFGIIICILQCAFIILKCADLTAIANWSWWIIFTPIWVFLGVTILVVLAWLIFYFIVKRMLR